MPISMGINMIGRYDSQYDNKQNNPWIKSLHIATLFSCYLGWVFSLNKIINK
jgi:hypothetical protein